MAGTEKDTVKILVACEFSGIVRDAFTERGHYVVSCDLLPSERPGAHYKGDVREMLTADDATSWDMMIAFPPCTHLSRSGQRWWRGTYEQEQSLDFVSFLLNVPIPRIALENPIGVISTAICKPDQIIQPWQYGHPETKATCLWLENLPLLTPTNIVEGRTPRVYYEPPGPDRWRNRSRTLQGIADAMAEQWTLT